MAVPVAWSDISTTAASNPPDGTTEEAKTVDNHLRQVYAFLKELYGDKGYIDLPSIASTGETIGVAGVGKCYKTTGNMTVPNATFAADDIVTIYNNSASSITITQGASLTLRLSGTSGTGNRTLAQRGLATIWFISASEAVISGPGLT
jgi:hypothetical protein